MKNMFFQRGNEETGKGTCRLGERIFVTHKAISASLLKVTDQ
jgi:hypothetical protein